MTTVTVIIPTNHARPEMLEEAIASVRAQTVPCELIIADGPGLPWQRVNEAVERSTTDAFTTLMDDDQLMPDFVKKMTAEMDRTNADLISCPLQEYGAQSGIHSPARLPFVTALCKKEMWQKAGGYDPLVGVAADADFYIACFEHGARMARVGEPLFKYRKHPGQWSNKGEWEEAMKRIRANHPNWHE